MVSNSIGVKITMEGLMADGLKTYQFAKKFLSIQDTKLSVLIKSGEIPCVVMGRRCKRIPFRGLIEYAERNLMKVIN
jgi:hypothetical protein